LDGFDFDFGVGCDVGFGFGVGAGFGFGSGLEIGSGFGIGFVDGPGCSVVVKLVVDGSHVAVWHRVYWMIAIHHHHYSKPNVVDHDRIYGE
jgi:hypothetical protein